MLSLLARTAAGLALACLASLAEATPAEFGTVWQQKGEVVAQEPGSPPRALAPGTRLYAGERIRSGPDAEALLRTRDGGLIAIRPDSEFQIQSYAAQGDEDDHQFLELTKGSLRLLSGWIGKFNKQAYRINTEDAAIGIRGTDHEPFVVPRHTPLARQHPAGTYDKVNHGTTVLLAPNSSLTLGKGQTGFVESARNQRGLLTLVQPRLLEAAPTFYQVGSFDEAFGQPPPEQDDIRPAPVAAHPHCPALGPAQAWLARFDHAIRTRDTPALLALIAPEARIDIDGLAPALSRAELAEQATQSLAQLTSFAQQRTLLLAEAGDAACRSIRIRSLVMESGEQRGQRYRYRAIEAFVIEHRDDNWLATQLAVHPYPATH